MSDLIDRADVLKFIHAQKLMIEKVGGGTPDNIVIRTANTVLDCLLNFINILPSVQPQRQTGKWIPVTERLPENDDKVLCCTVTTKGIRNIVIGYYMERWCCGMNSNVIAWQYLPEPYKDGGGA